MTLGRECSSIMKYIIPRGLHDRKWDNHNHDCTDASDVFLSNLGK